MPFSRQRYNDQPTGPGGSNVRGIDPYDRDSMAQAILMKLARQAAQGMLPVAELCPTDSVPSNGNIVLRATISNGISIQWPSDGIVVAIRATVRDGTDASAASTLLRVQVDGNEELFPSASGSGPGFLPFAQISGNASWMGRYSTRREFKQATAWSMYVQNAQAGADIVADITFDIVRTSNLRSG
jgi:hypothetical protein